MGEPLNMDATRWGLKQRPFPATPDSRGYYPATTHELALAHLLEAVNDGEGLALLTGAPGSGKTLVCHVLLERLATDVASVFLTNSHFVSRSALFQAILFDLRQPYDDASEQVLRLRLTEALLAQLDAGKRTVLLIDEAQHLSMDLLEELRLLGNLEAGRNKALQVLLAGQAGLLETLRRPELSALWQRVSVQCRLDPLDEEEAADYLRHHIRRAGGRPDEVFPDECIALLARHTRGLPRLLNQAAHQAFLLAGGAEADCVDIEMVLEALHRLGIEVDETALAADTSEEAKLAAEEPRLAVETLRPSA
jgi:general secretion pathway protein A